LEPASAVLYRRYELRHGLQEAAKARGETMTKEDADYCIDKALVTGSLDSNGNLNFHMRGTREEIITGILTTAKAWGQLMTCDQAERIADRANPESPLADRQYRNHCHHRGVYCRDCVGICPWATIEPIRGRRAMAGHAPG